MSTQNTRSAIVPRLPRTIGRLPLAALTACVLAFGCDAEAPTARATVDVDLSAFGVAEVTRDDGGDYRLLDFEGAELGRVDGSFTAGRVEVQATFAGQAGAFRWSDDEVSARCEDGTVLAAGAAAADAQASGGQTTSLESCADALAIGARVAEAEGSLAPWDRTASDEVTLRVLGCANTSAWVWGSSCSECMWASADKFVAAQNVPEGQAISFEPGTYQCSSGTIYTTCSRTWCD
jgi:hypothetical protein